MSKVQQDRWSSDPARVTSFIKVPVSGPFSSLADAQSQTYSSPRCGLGWRFDFSRNYTFASTSNPLVQQKIGNVTVTFKPDLCSRMPYKNLTMTVNVKTGQEDDGLIQEPCQKFHGLHICNDGQLGTYAEPFGHKGKTMVEVTVIFSPEDQLSFPTTPSPELADALAASLDGLALIDTKFYLFSRRSRGKPVSPRATFGNAVMLKRATTYFKDLLSGSPFQDGVLCGIHDDVPSILERLKTQLYDYEDDSDLEDLRNPPKDAKDTFAPPAIFPALFLKEETKAGLDTPPQLVKSSSSPPMDAQPSRAPSRSLSPPPIDWTAGQQLAPSSIEWERARLGPATPLAESSSPSEPVPPKSNDQVRAYAINGFAHRTWKAFIFYVYTNEIHFNHLRSQHMLTPGFLLAQKHKIACSPKSMYRLADYVNIPALKALAKEGISNGLSEENVVEELFSPFTSKYDEIIELEANFLVSHFTPAVSEIFDNAIGQVVDGLKPHCRRTVLFAIKMLRGVPAAQAWEDLSPQSRVKVKKGKKSTKK